MLLNRINYFCCIPIVTAKQTHSLNYIKKMIFLYTQRRPGSVFRPTESTCILPTKKMGMCLMLPEPMDFPFMIEPNPVLATSFRTLHGRHNQCLNLCGEESKTFSHSLLKGCVKIRQQHTTAVLLITLIMSPLE